MPEHIHVDRSHRRRSSLLWSPWRLAVGPKGSKAELYLCVLFDLHPIMFILLPCRFSPLYLHSCLPSRRGDGAGVCHPDLQQWCSSTCRELCMVQRYSSSFPAETEAEYQWIQVFLCAVCFLFVCNVNSQSPCICSPDMNSGSIPNSFRPQLHLSHLKYTDRGEYFCVARNSLGTDRSSPFLLNVTCESAGCFYHYCTCTVTTLITWAKMQ